MLEWILLIIIIVLLMIISWVDFKTLLIPNRLLYLLLTAALFTCFLESFMGNRLNLLDRVAGIFIISVPMYLLTKKIPNAFGGGDIKLMAVCGLFLGWKQIVMAALLSVLFGGFYSIGMILTKRIKKDGIIPFGPFLSMGIALSIIFGEYLWMGYLHLLGF